MSFDTLFGILACSAILHEESHEACHLRDILGEVTRRGYAVTETATVADAEASMRTDSAIGCVLLEWGDGAWRSETDALIGTIRARGLEMPIFLLVRRHRLDEIPVEVLGKVTGYLFLAEDMPDFIAKNLIGHLKIYAATLKTPFFGAMVDFAEEGNQVWTCPGDRKSVV